MLEEGIFAIWGNLNKDGFDEGPYLFKKPTNSWVVSLSRSLLCGNILRALRACETSVLIVLPVSLVSLLRQRRALLCVLSVGIFRYHLGWLHWIANAWLCLGNCIWKKGDLTAAKNNLSLALDKVSIKVSPFRILHVVFYFFFFVWALGFGCGVGVRGSGFRGQGLGFRIQDLGRMV